VRGSVYVYDSTGSNLLHIFVSKTIFYADFSISNRTLLLYLDTGVLYLDLFLLSTKLLETASQDNMLTLVQLIAMKKDHKSSSFVNSYNKTKIRPVSLINTIKPELSKNCRSLSDAEKYIAEIDGTASRAQMKVYILSGGLYKGH
jgi:hypothetical protein